MKRAGSNGIRLEAPVPDIEPETPATPEHDGDEPPLPVGPDYLHRLIRRFLSKLEPQERHDLRSWAARQGMWTVGTACSGTDCPVLVWKAFADVLRADMGVTFCVSHQFSTEKSLPKQKFLKSMFPELPLLIANTSELKNQKAQNLMTGKPCVIPGVKHFVAGFPCTDASMLNAKARSNENNCCVMNGSLNTGSVFHDLVEHMKKHRHSFTFGMFENVLALAWPPKDRSGQALGPSNMSVVSAMLSQFLDCYTKCWHLDPRMFGVPQSRSRVWMPSFKRDMLRDIGVATSSKQDLARRCKLTCRVGAHCDADVEAALFLLAAHTHDLFA